MNKFLTMLIVLFFMQLSWALTSPTFPLLAEETDQKSVKNEIIKNDKKIMLLQKEVACYRKLLAITFSLLAILLPILLAYWISYRALRKAWIGSVKQP